MALTRDEIVDTAVRLLGEVGLDGLSLRGVARELGVSAPTLYWHVTDKRALLDHVADRLLADPSWSEPLAAGQAWWAWLRDRALGQYRILVAHRDGALVVAGNRPTDATLPMVEYTLGVLLDAGFTPGEAHRSLLALGNLVIGSAVEHHAEHSRPTPDDRTPPDAVAYPNLMAVLGDLDPGEHEASFAHGLDLMIAGMRARLDQRERPTEAAAVSATWSK